MTRLLKYIGFLLVALVGLVALAVVVINVIPADKYKQIISSGVTSATGREMTIEGELDISLSSSLAFKASGIKFANAAWGSGEQMVSDAAIEAEVPLWPLLKGIVEVTLLVDAPELLLETSKSGQGNWQFSDNPDKSKTAAEPAPAVDDSESGGGFPLRLRIRQVDIRGNLAYNDGQTGEQVMIKDFKLVGQPVDDRLTIDLGAAINDIPLALTGAIGNGDFLVNSRPAPVSFEGNFGAVLLAIEGTVGPLSTGINFDMKVKVNSDSLASFSPLTGQEFPDLGPLTVSGHLVGQENKYAVKNLNISFADKSLTVDATASIADLLTLKGLTLDAEIGTDQLGDLVQAEQLSSLGTVKLTTHIASAGANFSPLNVKAELKTDIGSAGLNASVADVMKLTGLDANVTISTPSLDSLNELLSQELPASEQVSIEGKISTKGGLSSPLQLDIGLKSDGITGRITGSVAQPLAADGIELGVLVKADSLQQMSKLIGTGMSGTEPVQLDGKILVAGKKYQLIDLNLETGLADVHGSASLQLPEEPGNRSQINAVLHLGQLDISGLQKAIREEEAELIADATDEVEPEDNDEQEEKVVREKLFPTDPLPWHFLRDFDADVEVTMDTLKTLQLSLEGMVAGITLNNGLLSVKPLKAKVGNGTFGGYVTLDARNSPAMLDAEIELSDATFRDFGGQVNFLVDLEGAGNTVAEIMAGLDGQLEFDVRNATLKRSVMTNFGTGLLSSLNPFAEQDENTELICAIVFFDIENGVADANKAIAAQMPDVTWFGSGEINLETEKIDFGMSPKARKGLVGVGGLAKLAHIGGTLTQPKVGFDSKEAAVKYGKYSAAVATGGLTLVVDTLFSRIKANKDICSAIIEKLDKVRAEDEQKRIDAGKKSEGQSEVQAEEESEGKSDNRKKKRKSTVLSGDSYL